MKLIFDIRGLNGSGKSRVIRDFIGSYPAKQLVDKTAGEKNQIYAFRATEVIATQFKRHRLECCAIGRYDITSGGCDIIRKQDQIVNRVFLVADKNTDIILFEGVIVSTIASRYIKLARSLQQVGQKYVVCYLDTPFEQCVKNIYTRRETSKVKRKEFNQEIMRLKNISILATRPKFEAAGIETLTLRWPTPLQDLESFVGEYARKELATLA